MKQFMMLGGLLLGCTLAAKAIHIPITLTASSFNADVIAEGVGAPLGTTNAAVDALGNDNVFVSQDFQYSAACAPLLPGQGLPVSGYLVSALSSQVPYQLAPYTANNDLRLTSGNNGTLTFVTPQACRELHLLTLAGQGSGTVTATVHFTDGTTQAFTGLTIADWYGGPNVVTLVARISRTTTACPVNQHPGGPKMYQTDLALSPANFSKQIDYINVAQTGGAGVVHVFAVTATTDCSGQPVAGTPVLMPGSCPSVVALIGVQSDMQVQWQKRTDCGAWTDIPGATNANYTITSLPAAAEFRASLTCPSSGLSDISNPLFVPYILPCYAVSNATVAQDEDIENVTFGNLNNTSSCVLTGGAGSVYNEYSDYTRVLPPANVFKGSPVPFSLAVNTCDNAVASGISMFIDLNADGDFADANETIYQSSAGGVSPYTVADNYTIPLASAYYGKTMLRVVNIQATASPAATGTYTKGETEDYTVNILYAPNVTGGGIICSGSNDTLRASAPAISNFTFAWTDPAGNQIGTAAELILSNMQTSQSGIYRVYMLRTPCNGGTADTIGGREVELYVNQTPPPPQVHAVITYCQYAAFDTIEIYGQDLKWYTVPTGGTPATIDPVINTSVLGSVTWYVSQTVNGCESERKAVTINVVPQAAAPQVVTPVTYCQGETALPLQATGQNILWYSIPAGGVGTPVTPTPGTNAQGTFTWYVSQTIAGCESPRVPVAVHINYRPNGIIIQSRPYVCQHDTLTLAYYGNADASADYVWDMPKGATLEGGSDAGPLVVRFDSAGTLRVKLRVDNGGCLGPDILANVDVRLSPVFGLDIQPDACKDDIINLAVNYATPGIDHYDWDMSGAEIVYGAFSAGPYGVRWAAPGDKVITVIATNDECKSLPVTDTVHVHDLPVADIVRVDAAKICTGDSVQLEAYYEPGYVYHWSPEAFFSEGHEAHEWARIDFSGNVYLMVTDPYNCKANDSLMVHAESCCQVYFPNAFTPNSDGKNDVFRVISPGHHQLSGFRVQNRWGQTVFETADERKGWDGTYSGVPQDMGTYYYYIKYKCTDGQFYEQKGEVTLIR